MAYPLASKHFFVADEPGERPAPGDLADGFAQFATHLEADPVAARANETETARAPSRTSWVRDMGASVRQVFDQWSARSPSSRPRAISPAQVLKPRLIAAWMRFWASAA